MNCFFVSLGPHDFDFLAIWAGKFWKRWLYTNLEQQQEVNFSIEKSILGGKPTSGKAAFQSNFKFYDGDTWKFFELSVANIYVTLQNLRRFTHHRFSMILWGIGVN